MVAGPLPLGSSLVCMGRIARTISRLWKAHLSLERSLGAIGGLIASRTTPLVVSFSFSAALTSSASLGGSLEEERALLDMPLLQPRSLGTVSTWSSKGLMLEWLRDNRRFLLSLGQKSFQPQPGCGPHSTPKGNRFYKPQRLQP